MLPFKQRLSI